MAQPISEEIKQQWKENIIKQRAFSSACRRFFGTAILSLRNFQMIGEKLLRNKIFTDTIFSILMKR